MRIRYLESRNLKILCDFSSIIFLSNNYYKIFGSEIPALKALKLNLHHFKFSLNEFSLHPFIIIPKHNQMDKDAAQQAMNAMRNLYQQPFQLRCYQSSRSSYIDSPQFLRKIFPFIDNLPSLNHAYKKDKGIEMRLSSRKKTQGMLVEQPPVEVEKEKEEVNLNVIANVNFNGFQEEEKIPEQRPDDVVEKPKLKRGPKGPRKPKLDKEEFDGRLIKPGPRVIFTRSQPIERFPPSMTLPTMSASQPEREERKPPMVRYSWQTQKQEAEERAMTEQEKLMVVQNLPQCSLNPEYQRQENPLRQQGGNIDPQNTQPLQPPSEIHSPPSPHLVAPKRAKKQPKFQGLKELSLRVRDMIHNRKTPYTYKQVAQVLIKETSSSGDKLCPFMMDFRSREIQNIRRRVYDALNVLIAAGILMKEGKRVSKFPTSIPMGYWSFMKRIKNQIIRAKELEGILADLRAARKNMRIAGVTAMEVEGEESEEEQDKLKIEAMRPQRPSWRKEKRLIMLDEIQAERAKNKAVNRAQKKIKERQKEARRQLRRLKQVRAALWRQDSSEQAAPRSLQPLRRSQRIMARGRVNMTQPGDYEEQEQKRYFSNVRGWTKLVRTLVQKEKAKNKDRADRLFVSRFEDGKKVKKEQSVEDVDNKMEFPTGAVMIRGDFQVERIEGGCRIISEKWPRDLDRVDLAKVFYS